MSGESASSKHVVETDQRQICANGSCVQINSLEAQLDAGKFDEAESDLREGLSLNSEEARALLGRLEYQRGNVEAALKVFESIDIHATIERLESISTDKIPKKSRDSGLSGPQQGAILLLEAIYLKTKSLQKLDRINDAAEECKKVLDAVEKIFPQGIPDAFVETKLQETISRVVELLPQLWAEAGSYQEAVSSYRRSLLTQWNLDNNSCARIQLNFAVLLLYSGVEAGPPTTTTKVEGTYVPKSNLEEAILLLMICMRKFSLGQVKWDPRVVEHLTFALSICNQTPILAKQLEEVIPGVIHRVDLWKTLALCCSAVNDRKTALDLLKKALHKHERPFDIPSLLLAAKICSEDGFLAAEGAEFAQRAVNNCSKKSDEHLKGVCLRVLGLCYGKQASVSSSDYERSNLQSKALKSLDEAISLEPENSDMVFELAIQYAMHRNLNNALRLAKQYIDVTGGSMLRGWRLLALILSAQQRFQEAEVVTDAALDETGKWDQGPLLRLKAKLRIAQSRHMDAIETYRHLLALIQAQKKTYGPLHSTHEIENDRVDEYEVWQGLANLYSSLARWKDAEICLGKAREIIECSSKTLHTEGTIYQRRGEIDEALATYVNSLLVEASYVPSKISIGAIMYDRGLPMLPVARTMLSDALRLEPTNRMAWLHLGFVHKLDGRLSDAIDSFQAASMLEESDPIESFSSIF
ncbi:protein NPG1 [Rutidosis leptorrhynchoides]|uniref:protein NPG1 n=1 Tax=Rutidosis leptorrhynchoides TaxID=125765 RepID=UPI003A99E62B